MFSSRLSLLFTQSKNTELSFFISQIFTSALFYSSSSLFVTSSLLLLFLLFCALMVTIFCVLFLVLLVHSSLNICFIFTVFKSLSSNEKNDDQFVDLVRKTLLGHNHHSCSFCVNVCAAFFFSFYFLYIVSKTHKAPALLALFSPTSVFHCFHPRTFLFCQ